MQSEARKDNALKSVIMELSMCKLARALPRVGMHSEKAMAMPYVCCRGCVCLRVNLKQATMVI